MSILMKIFAAADDDGASALNDPKQWLLDAFIGRRTKSGANVSPKTALGLSAYYACIRNLSEDIGKLPFKAYRAVGAGKEEIPTHPAYKLLHNAPNPNMIPIVFRETLTAWAMGWGAGFAEIERSGVGVPLALWPIHPSRVRVMRGGTRDMYYRIKGSDIAGVDVRLNPENALHIHGLGEHGVNGYPLSVLAKEAIGMGLEAEAFGARFYRNDATPGVILEYPGRMKKEAVANLRESWDKKFGGAEKSHKTAVLEEGVKVQKISIPPNEAQFIESRQFQVEDVARWFRMPPHKIGHLLRSTFNNIESQSVEYVTDAIMPWAVRWEQETTRKLFTEKEADLFTRFSFNSLLRGTPVKRAAFYRGMFQIGVFSQNMILALEDMNGIGPDGDVHYVPANMVPSEVAAKGEPAASKAEPQKEPDDNAREVRESMLPVMEAAIKRVMTKEAKAVTRAAAKYDPKDFDAWLQEFYIGQRDYFWESIMPSAQAYAKLASRNGFNIVGLISEMIEKIVAESRYELVEAYHLSTVEKWSESITNELPHVLAELISSRIDAAVRRTND